MLNCQKNHAIAKLCHLSDLEKDKVFFQVTHNGTGLNAVSKKYREAIKFFLELRFSPGSESGRP